MSELTLSVEHTINAPIEFVYNAWLDPTLMARFMTPAPGVVATDISTEPHVGGRFAVTMIVDGNHLEHKGEYLTLEPYTKLVFTWLSPFSIDGSTVTLNLSEAVGGTHIELTQVKFLNEEMRDNHNNGWVAILACLNQVLTATGE